MAKTTRKITSLSDLTREDVTESETDPSPEEIPQHQLSDREMSAIERETDEILEIIRSNATSGFRFKVFRKLRNELQASYMGEIDATPIYLETVKDLFGGGDYQLNLCTPEGKYKKRISMTIGHEIKPLKDRNPMVTPIASHGSHDQMYAFMQQSNDRQIALMQSNATQNMQLMTAILGRPATPSPEREPTSKFLLALTPLLVPVIGKIADRLFETAPGVKPKNMLENLEELKAMKQVFAEIVSPVTPEKDEEKPSTFDKAMEFIIPIGQGLLQRMQGGQPIPLTPNQIQQLPEMKSVNPVVAEKPNDPLENETNKVMYRLEVLVLKLRQNLGMILTVAKFMPIDKIIVMLVGDEETKEEGFIPLEDQELYDVFIELLKREDWLSLLLLGDDRAIKHKEWFDKLRNSLLKYAEESEQSESEPVPIPVQSPE